MLRLYDINGNEIDGITMEDAGDVGSLYQCITNAESAHDEDVEESGEGTMVEDMDTSEYLRFAAEVLEGEGYTVGITLDNNDLIVIHPNWGFRRPY